MISIYIIKIEYYMKIYNLKYINVFTIYILIDKNNETKNLIKLHHNITYNDSNLFDRYTIINKDEQKEFRNLIYKYDLICIFGLNDFEEEINK